MQDRTQSGFTLYEALIVLAITAILICAGVPAMGSLLERTQVRGEHDEFLTAVNYTRSLAVDMAARVVMCPSIDRTSCAEEPEWHRGWVVFEDLDKDRERDEDETVFLSHGELTSGVTITSSRHRRRIGFLPSGLAYGANLTLRICPRDVGVHPKAIIISNAGRPRSVTLPPASCS